MVNILLEGWDSIGLHFSLPSKGRVHKLRIILTHVPSAALHVIFLPFVVPLPLAEASVVVAKILISDSVESVEEAAGQRDVPR